MEYNLPDSSVHGISQQKYWSGLPFPFPGHLPDSGMEPTLPALAGIFFNHWTTKEAHIYFYIYVYICSFPDSFSFQVITRYWVYFSVLYNRSLLVSYFIYSSVYLLTPKSLSCFLNKYVAWKNKENSALWEHEPSSLIAVCSPKIQGQLRKHIQRISTHILLFSDNDHQPIIIFYTE